MSFLPTQLPPHTIPILGFLFVAVHTCVYCPPPPSCHCIHATARCSQDGIIGENVCAAYFSQGLSLANYCLDGSQRFSPITRIFPHLVCGRRPRLGSPCQRGVVSGNSVAPRPAGRSVMVAGGGDTVLAGKGLSWPSNAHRPGCYVTLIVSKFKPPSEFRRSCCRLRR